MGKIRIKTLGTSEEQAQKQRAKVRRLEKKKRLTHIAGLKGGERIVDMSAAPEVPEAGETPLSKDTSGVGEALPRGGEIKEVGEKRLPRQRGKAYLAAKKLVEPGKLYPPSEAIELVKKTTLSKFDGSVEVHLNTTEKGLRGQVNFPHGIGRKTRVAVADEKVIEALENGKIDFDVLVASPSIMPKLAKFGKLLGPRGLMPNPKTGTISEEPKKLAEKLSRGQIQFKTESEAPIIHQVIGKTSFPSRDLEENLATLIKAIGAEKIKSVFLKSTMSPSVKVQI